MDVKKIISQIAEKNGISYEEVYEDMKEGILEGYRSGDPAIRKAWEDLGVIGHEPTPEEAIIGISLMLMKGDGTEH